jgi:hypothetical protein
MDRSRNNAIHPSTRSGSGKWITDGACQVMATVELKRLCSLLVLNWGAALGWSLANLLLWHVLMY